MNFIVFQVLPNSNCSIPPGKYVGCSLDGQRVDWYSDSNGCIIHGQSTVIDDNVVVLYNASSTSTGSNPQMESTLYDLSQTLMNLQSYLMSNSGDSAMLGQILSTLTDLVQDRNEKVKAAVDDAVGKMKAKVSSTYADIGDSFWED